MNKNPDIKPDFWLVALDETPYWMLPADIMQHIERIEAVFVFDRNEATYLCEMTPSYCLYLVEHRPVFKDDDLDERIKERGYDTIQGAFIDDDIDYMHCHAMDQLIEKLKNEEYRVAHYGAVPDDWIDPENEMAVVDAVIEDCRSNGRL